MKWNIVFKNLPRKEKLKLIKMAEKEIEEWEEFLDKLQNTCDECGYIDVLLEYKGGMICKECFDKK